MQDTPARTRTETDSFGPLEVASDRYWGAQTQRSLGNFKIGGERMPLALVRALGIIKKCAAITNVALGQLDEKLGKAIAPRQFAGLSLIALGLLVNDGRPADFVRRWLLRLWQRPDVSGGASLRMINEPQHSQ